MSNSSFSEKSGPLPAGLANPVLSVGTQVVVHLPDAAASTLNGTVGVIAETPTDPQALYKVRFSNGTEDSFYRSELVIRKHFQQANPLQLSANEADQAALTDELYDYVIYRCIVGSRAYGLDTASSDTDRRGFYLPPADRQWSFQGVPEQLENKASEECYWELQKFMLMALKANPNVLECLYTPLVETVTPLAQELLDNRQLFLSKMVYQTYNGYVLSQFKKLEQDLRNRGEIRWKHAMHLIRLLLSGIGVLQTGQLTVRVQPEQRDLLLQIKQGQLAWPEIDRLRLQLHSEFDAAFAATALPERPDYAAANAFLLKARRSMVG